MYKLTKTLIASAALALTATPAIAQEEEARTTYEVTMIAFADGGEDRWAEIFETYVVPAHEAAGQTPPVVHWIMMGSEHDVMVLNYRPMGMAAFDTHANPGREAFMAALMGIVGGEEELAALGAEYGTLIESETSLWTHTHP